MNQAIIDIDSLAYGGSGVGRLDGMAVFVPFTAPGDRARIELTRQKKNFAEGELLELLRPSAKRRVPTCPVFGRCGGCQWQHLPYAEQLRWKEEIFARTLERQAGIDPELTHPAEPAPDEWRYRSRVQFKCRQTHDGFVIGFYRRGTHFVIDVEQCPVAAEGINRILSHLRRELPRLCEPHRVPQVDVSEDDEGALRIVVHYIGRRKDRIAGELESLAAKTEAAVFMQSGRSDTLRRIAGEENLIVVPRRAPELRLGYGPGGFAQVNLEQNRKLVEAVVAATNLTGRERVLDLFCGMGNFSLPLAGGARQVVGVEDYPPSIASARDNARDNGIANADFHARPAEGALAELGAGDPFDLVVLDPPRTGAYNVARELAGVRPSRLVYVSCDPPTLGRDLNPLLHNGYRLVRAQAFDLFPQTRHVESVVLLERIDERP